MTSDISLAFAHPEERAIASASADPRDRILLRDYLVDVEIGAFQQERGTRQRVCFNVVVEVSPHAIPLDDDVDRILSYDRITEAISAELAADRLNLLETLAEGVAERILAEPRAMRVFVRIEKLDRGPFALGVEIARARAATPIQTKGASGAQESVHPLVVFLDAAAIAHSNIVAILDDLSLRAKGLPVVLCVGLPNLDLPTTGHRPTQRRVDLLAIEQNAWTLAARDDRCVVVSSRTEIDWAIKQGNMIVWAPSKLVLDAVDGPTNADPLALALWLAENLAASELLVHGDATLPAGSRVPVSRAALKPALIGAPV
ncbi:MAG TPA: diguanylate cyclase [Rhodobacter sp.]|nr:diguanylate cyclase [Rhodobacter sp.]